MRHEWHLEGMAFRIRPVAIEDAEFIVDLRSNPELTEYLPPLTQSIDQQKTWLGEYFLRANDYYFVIERIQDSSPHGLISLYNFDLSKREAEWGRWLIKPGSLAAPESALLIYRLGFDYLNLARIYCRSVMDNKAVVSFHDDSGLIQCRILDNFYNIREQSYSAIEHEAIYERWPTITQNIESRATKVARLLGRKTLL